MQRLWEALNRSGLVHGAFWFTVWVVVAMLLHVFTGLLIKMDMQQVNVVLVPLRTRIDAGLSTVLQLVGNALVFAAGSYADTQPGAINYLVGSVGTAVRLSVLLVVLFLSYHYGQKLFNALVKMPAVALEAAQNSVLIIDEKAKQKTDELAFRALQVAARKLGSLSAPDRAAALPAPPPVQSPPAPRQAEPVPVSSGRQTIQYQRPAGNKIPIHSQDHGDIRSLGLDERVSHAEPVVRNAYRAAYARATTDAEKIRAKEAWTRLCAYYGWSP